MNVDDVWASVDKGHSVSLWCEKVKGRSKRKSSGSNSDSDSEDGSDSVCKSKKKKYRKKKRRMSVMEERNERIISCKAYGNKFTKIQYHMWSGLIDSEKHM